ncbi:DUF2786 domain-containing protein [Alteromonas sp. KUL49]|uniref:DUF2786 domain-containing protein n=1 Tax=Alteromonas sp. KUL49 TaxID=2480798 RepID=UPI00102EEBA1|nr:DUF2786 domain-containing protein [Alteromonas sp. KUL49]TAP38755.1 DUF2786 domain-containing protein [Alteromonas sp. KUL49]GEA12710.1 phage protein [Alteromonas sp. KUL49]
MSDKILIRIKKLLAMAKSGNPHEAANALSRAQKLMQQHGIDETAIALSEVEKSESLLLGASKPQFYEAMLANLIKRAFAVEPVVNYALDKNFNLKSQFWFCGISPSNELAAYCFDVLYRQLKRARADFTKTLNNNCKRSTKTSRANAFCVGWINTVSKQVSELSLAEPQKQLVHSFISKSLGSTETKSVEQNRSGKERYADYERGAIAADGVVLNPGVNGTSQPALNQAL